MTPLESVTARGDALSPVYQKLRGERLTVDSDEENWSPRRRLLFILLTGVAFWSGLFFLGRSLF
jgi:hypothetical protein